MPIVVEIESSRVHVFFGEPRMYNRRAYPMLIIYRAAPVLKLQ